MIPDHIKHIYMLGIGGIGMSALARFFKRKGYVVAGYDKTESVLTQQLMDEGMDVHYDDNPELLKSLDSGQCLVIYTPAVPTDLGEYAYLQQHGFDMKKRAEMLGAITRDYTTIAVAGTHGKTTTCSMIAHIFQQAGLPVIAFIGGISPNFGSNLIMDDQAEIIIVEADEYDKSFLHLHPDSLIITSMDADHLDVYGSEEEMIDTYQSLISQVPENGSITMHENVMARLSRVDRPTRNFGMSAAAQCRISALRHENEKSLFTLVTPDGTQTAMKVSMPGIHNALNATAASICASEYGISLHACSSALEKYKGVKRRFEFVLKSDFITVIDDYAHHPEEINQLATSVRAMYPDKKITAVFQPHLYSRTRDFAKEFGTSLSLFDRVILLPIYPAREEPIPGVTSSMLEAYINCDVETIEKKELAPTMKQLDTDILLTVGAGDIDRLIPEIVQQLKATS